MLLDLINIKKANLYPCAILFDNTNYLMYVTKLLQDSLRLNKEINDIEEICGNAQEFIDWYKSLNQNDFDLQLIDSKQQIQYYRIQKLQIKQNEYILLAIDITNLINKEKKDDQLIIHNQPLTNTLPCGLFKAALDEKMTLTYKNVHFCKIFGYLDIDELTTINQLIIKEDYQNIHNQIIESKQKDYNELEIRCCCKNGQVLWVQINYIFDQNSIYGVAINIEKQKNVEKWLKITKQEYQIALRQSKNILLHYHIPTKTLTMENFDKRLLGQDTQIKNVPDIAKTIDIVAKECMDDYFKFYQDMIAGIPEGHALFKIRLGQHSDYTWVNATYAISYDEYYNPVTSIISYQDYSKEHEHQSAFQNWVKLFESQKANSVAYYEYDLTRDYLESVEDCMFEKGLKDIYNSFTKMVEYCAENFVYPEDKQNYLSVFNREHLIASYYQDQNQIVCDYRRYDNLANVYWARGNIQLIEDIYSNTVKAFVFISNITEEKEKEYQMQVQLQTDSLTGLYNRNGIVAKIENMFEQEKDSPHALIMLDLDNFKQLNDQLGHIKGDEALCYVAKMILQHVEKKDLCARLGGDEFIIFFPKVKNNLNQKLKKLTEVLNFSVNEINISASIGASLYPLHGNNFTALYQKADEAMYQSKRFGKNCFSVYSEGNTF